jgi:lysophospholipase L1-like esterase
MHAVNGWIRALAAREPGIWFCDTRAAVARPDHPDQLISSPDRLHPDVRGYRRMAEALLPVIERALTGTADG